MTNSELADAIYEATLECQRAHVRREVALRKMRTIKGTGSGRVEFDEADKQYLAASDELQRLEDMASARGGRMGMVMLPFGLFPWPVSVPAFVPDSSDTLHADER